MDLNDEIKNELSKALEQLGAHPMLLAIVSSWGDTLMSDAKVLDALRDWNNGTFRGASITSVKTGKPPLKLIK